MVVQRMCSFQWSALSDIGCTRKENQDYWKAFPKEGLFAIADGMGGKTSGAVAAQEAITALDDYLPGLETHGLDYIIKAVNRQVFKKSLSKDMYHGMGTTLSLLFFSQEEAFYSHVGDSRIYLFRQGILQQLTEDHSVAQLLIQDGVGVETSCHYQHILTQAIGTKTDIYPSSGSLALKSDDLFLLCSDGLTHLLSSATISTILHETTNLDLCAHRLVTLAKEAGGTDNITVILVKAQENDLL